MRRLGWQWGAAPLPARPAHIALAPESASPGDRRRPGQRRVRKQAVKLGAYRLRCESYWAARLRLRGRWARNPKSTANAVWIPTLSTAAMGTQTLGFSAMQEVQLDS